MPSFTAPDRSRRKNVLRRDATIGSAEREIARVFGIPDRCVRLVNKNGRKGARINTSANCCGNGAVSLGIPLLALRAPDLIPR